MTSFQSSELTELPVVENSQLFAQRVHSARYAPLGFGALTSRLCFPDFPDGVTCRLLLKDPPGGGGGVWGPGQPRPTHPPTHIRKFS